MEHYNTFIWLENRNKKYTIRRALLKAAFVLAILAFIVWGWSLPEV